MIFQKLIKNVQKLTLICMMIGIYMLMGTSMQGKKNHVRKAHTKLDGRPEAFAGLPSVALAQEGGSSKVMGQSDFSYNF